MKNQEIPIRKIKDDCIDPHPTYAFKIRSLSEFTFKKEMIQNVHRHSYYFLMFIDKGSGEHHIDFKMHRVDNHLVFLLKPGQVHSVFLKRGTTGTILQFEKDFYNPANNLLSQSLRTLFNANKLKMDETSFQKVKAQLDEIFSEAKDKRENFHHIIKSYIDIILYELLREYKSKRRSLESKTLNVQNQLEEFIDLVEDKASELKQVKEYADALNLTFYQLNKITKTSVGKTPSEVINEHIILESKRQLLATSNQIKEIAFELGYLDVSYYIRFFKKQTGYTPEQFRAQFQKSD